MYIGFYTPEQLGITDLNNDSTSVPWFRKTVVDSETGSSETFECTNMRKVVDVYKDKYEYVNEKTIFGRIKNFVIEVGLKNYRLR